MKPGACKLVSFLSDSGACSAGLRAVIFHTFPVVQGWAAGEDDPAKVPLGRPSVP